MPYVDIVEQIEIIKDIELLASLIAWQQCMIQT